MNDLALLQRALGFHAGLLAVLSFSDLDISIIAWVALVDAFAFAVLIVRDILIELYEP